MCNCLNKLDMMRDLKLDVDGCLQFVRELVQRIRASIRERSLLILFGFERWETENLVI